MLTRRARRAQTHLTIAIGVLRRRGRWSPRSRRDQIGSGTAIGVAVLFTPLMLLIVSLSMLTGSARIEQALQATANRAARTAALCCHHTGDAEAVVRASLAAAESAAAINRIVCNNDLVGDSRTIFIDVNGNSVPIDGVSAVPPGGMAYVELTCRVPAEVLGGVGFPGLDVERRAVGVAAIDPFRSRSGG